MRPTPVLLMRTSPKQLSSKRINWIMAMETRNYQGATRSQGENMLITCRSSLATIPRVPHVFRQAIALTEFWLLKQVPRTPANCDMDT